MTLELAPLRPKDEHNQILEANVHPPDWRNPTPSGRYNLVVVGAGTAGLVTAAVAAGLGAKVALVERELMGGDCLNVGCVPSKALIAAARAAAAVRRAGEFGVRTAGTAEVDFAAVMERMRSLRARISGHDAVRRFAAMGVDVFLGQGRFTGPDTLQVGEATLRFKRGVIATGARASAPPIAGLETVNYLTNETLFSLTELPPRLGIVGAGPIGCEMAQTFARFGSRVTLFEAEHGVLPREDRDAAGIVERALQRDGVRLLCCGKDLVVAPGKAGGARLRVASHGETHEVPVDALLVAVGRAPNVEGLGLEEAGVQVERGGVVVDDRLRTTNRRIFAAGDVCSPYKFTHAADFMARIVVQNALFLPTARVSRLVVPWCTYTSPELAHVGLSVAEAEREGVAVDTYTQELEGVDRAVLDGDAEGFVRIHVAKGKDRILGATVVAAHAGDLIGEISLAMTHGLGLGKVASAIHPYPTQAEAIRKAGDLYGRTRLTPRVAKWLRRWLAWTR